MRRLKRHPIRLGLHVARAQVGQRRRDELQQDEREQRDGDRLRVRHAAASARHARDHERHGEREQREPSNPLDDVVAREVTAIILSRAMSVIAWGTIQLMS